MRRGARGNTQEGPGQLDLRVRRQSPSVTKSERNPPTLSVLTEQEKRNIIKRSEKPKKKRIEMEISTEETMMTRDDDDRCSIMNKTDDVVLSEQRGLRSNIQGLKPENGKMI